MRGVRILSVLVGAVAVAVLVGYAVTEIARAAGPEHDELKAERPSRGPYDPFRADERSRAVGLASINEDRIERYGVGSALTVLALFVLAGILDAALTADGHWRTADQRKETWLLLQALLPVIGTSVYFAIIRPTLRA